MLVRVGVVGSGIMGACAARALAKAGCSVTVFEQFDVDHDRGSSYGDSRIIRRFYDDGYYTRLMESAYPLWRELEREVGQPLLLQTGGLYFAPRGHSRIESALAALRAHGSRHQALDAVELRRRFRQFAFADDEVGIVDEEAGLLRASACVRAAAASAAALGASFVTRTRVARVDEERGAPAFRLESGELVVFDGAIVCAGPWSAKLLTDLALPLRVTKQQYAFLRPTARADIFEANAMPVWIDAPTQWYGFPHHGAIEGCKVASHDFGPTIDPDDPARQTACEVIERTRAYARRRLPSLAGGEVTFAKVCLYTVTPDEDFILDAHPAMRKCFFIAGLSGHGFKFGTLLGALAADLALERAPSVDISRLRLARFRP